MHAQDNMTDEIFKAFFTNYEIINLSNNHMINTIKMEKLFLNIVLK